MKPSTCNDCPYANDKCVLKGIWSDEARLTFIVDKPSWVSINARFGNSEGVPFKGRAGILLRKIGKIVKQVYPDIDFKYSACYASGSGKKVLKKSIDACKFVWGRNWISRYVNTLEEHVVIAMGIDAVKALGIKTKKISDVRGTIIKTSIGAKNVTVIPTLSVKHIYASPGLINILLQDVLSGVKIAYLGDDITPKTIEELSKHYICPTTIEEVREVCNTIKEYYDPAKQDSPDKWPISVDIETNTLKPHIKSARINAISFAWDDKKATAIMLDHPETPYDPDIAWGYVKEILEGPKPKTFHNGKFDIKFIKHVKNTVVNNFSWDTMLVEHWLDEDKKGTYGLKVITRNYLPEYSNYEKDLYTYLSREEQEEDNGFENVPIRILLPYAAADADVTRQIQKLQIRKLKRNPAYVEECRYVLDHLYIPGSLTLGELEYSGINIDRKLLSEYKTQLDELIDNLRRDIYSIALQEFNINSLVELGNVLLSCGIPILEKTETGQVSITKAILEQYQKMYMHAAGQPIKDQNGLLTDAGRLELVEKLLIYRSAFKMRNTFLTRLESYIDEDGRIHAGFKLNGTATGRLSSSSPNMQNIPKLMCYITRTDGENKEVLHPGYNVKDLFIPDNDDHVFWNADIKAAELRVLTYYSQDKELIDTINKGIDVHTVILTHIKHPDVPVNLSDKKFMDLYNHYIELKDAGDKDINNFRTKVKRTVFGTLYGAKARKIAQQIGDESEEGVRFAQQIINAIFKAYPNIKTYIASVENDIRKHHQTKTAFHRRRRFWMAQMYSSLMYKAYREAINFKIQSTASDLTLMALCDVQRNIHKLGGNVLLTVHDSIAGSIPKDSVAELPEFLDKHIIENTKLRFPGLPVPFTYDIEVGPTYGSLMPIQQYLEQETNETKEGVA